MDDEAFECMLHVHEQEGSVTLIFHDKARPSDEAEGFVFGLDQVKRIIVKLQNAVEDIERRAAPRNEGGGRLFFFGKEDREWTLK